MLLSLGHGAGLKHMAQGQNAEIQCSGKTITAPNEVRQPMLQAPLEPVAIVSTTVHARREDKPRE